ncbi:MAG TPA: hypothetical protein DEO87_03500 [Lachnospiraceae bacterium]|nr:hypothetical protein [Lachnospiraceae bacterium]
MIKRGFIKRIAAVTALSFILTELPVFPASGVYAAEEKKVEGESSYLSYDLYDEYGLNFDYDYSVDNGATGAGGKIYYDPDSTEQTTEETTQKLNADGNIILDDTSKVEKYSVTPDEADAEQYSDYGAISAWKNRSTVKAPENTYCMHIGTGAAKGDTILYFEIMYTDMKNQSRTQFIFPSLDAQDKSDSILKYGANGKDINDTYGTQMLKQFNYGEQVANENPLGDWTVQDYVFQTEAEIQNVDGIKFYLAQGSWTIQGLEIYKVDEYKGYEEYGMVSGKRFLDFKGRKIAAVVKTNSGTLTYSTSGADAVVEIGEDESVNDYAVINNYNEYDEGVDKDYAVEKSVLSFRMDFVDQIDGGLETLINPAAATNEAFKKNIVEDIVIEFQYKDKSGWTRKVALPVLLSSYGSLLEKEKNGVLIGFAQRGDTLAFSGLYPEIDYIVGNVTMYVGNSARKKLDDNGISVAKSTDDMKNTLTSLNSDDIQVAGISFSRGGCMPYIQDGIDSKGNKVTGASLDYAFQNGTYTYFTTTDERGREIKQGGRETFKLSAYKENAPLVASQSVKNKYLVTVTTSNIARTGTKDDVTMRFKYQTRAGQQNKTALYNVKTAAVDFLGTWPSTSGTDFIKSIALTEGSTVEFLIDAINLKQFLSADITLSGSDEWQLNNLSIDYVERFQKRRAYLVDTESNGVVTHYWIDRSLVSAQIFNMNGSAITVVDKDGNLVRKDGSKIENGKTQALDKDGNPIYIDTDDVVSGRAVGDSQFFGGKTGYTFNFTDGDIEKVEKIDYSDVRYKMTYEQTAIDWGFFEKDKIYDVSVKVADDPDYDNGDGDSGSKNYFYFQLLFENGKKSAYVLANQQLTSDGFRSGKTETFSIATNRNYGKVTAIRIIPEDLSEDSDVFDKLNIEKIMVTEATNGGAYMSYVIDNVGWIEIDYRDEMESVVPGGQKARTAEEIARRFPVTNMQKSVRLLCEMVTLPWDNDYLQFQGSVIAEITYVDASTNKIQTASFDVVQYIAAYMNKSAKSVETSTDPNSQLVKAAGLNTISDPEWMFRPNHTDRFIMPAIADLGSIKSIQFTAQTRNGYPAIWNIGQITISQIVEDSGSLQLTTNEEYYRDIETQELCISTNTKVISTTLPIGKAQRTPKINFTDNQIVWVSDEWATPVSRIPNAADDTVNIYLYPTASSRNIDGVSPNITYQYGVPFSKYMQVSFDGMYAANSGTKDAVFYVKGLNTADFVSSGKLTLQCTSTKVSFDYAIVQHMRGDVVIGTYEYNFMDSSAVLGVVATPSKSNMNTKKTAEKLVLQFGKETEKQELIQEENDIAVCVHYTSLLDPTGTEYSTSYVYMTDQGYSSISEGLLAEIDFNENFVDEVTGYSIAAYGNLKGNIIASAVYAYDVIETSTSVVTFEEYPTETVFKSYSPVVDNSRSFTLSESLTKRRSKNREYYGPDSATPIEMHITTLEGPKQNKQGQIAKIRATFNYKDYKDTIVSKTYDDITQYIIAGDDGKEASTVAETRDDRLNRIKTKQFISGKTQVVKIFLEDMGSDYDLISVDIFPYYEELKTDKDIMDVVEDAANERDDATNAEIEASQNGTTVDAKVEDPDNPSAETILEDTLTNGDVSWTIQSVTTYRADSTEENGDILPLKRENINQKFSGLQQGGTLKFDGASLITSIAKNGNGDKTIAGEPVNYLAKKDDLFTGKAVVTNSTEGFTVHAYRMVGEARDDVTEENVVVDQKANKFWFVVPESKDPYSDTVYLLEISPTESPDVVDKVIITVEKTKNAGDAATEKTTEESTEKSTDKSTEETTESGTEGGTEDGTESNTEDTTEENSSSQTDDGLPYTPPVENN